jgi:hypothetical protein
LTWSFYDDGILAVKGSYGGVALGAAGVTSPGVRGRAKHTVARHESRSGELSGPRLDLAQSRMLVAEPRGSRSDRSGCVLRRDSGPPRWQDRRAYSAPTTLRFLLTKTWCGQLTPMMWTLYSPSLNTETRSTVPPG